MEHTKYFTDKKLALSDTIKLSKKETIYLFTDEQYGQYALWKTDYVGGFPQIDEPLEKLGLISIDMFEPTSHPDSDAYYDAHPDEYELYDERYAIQDRGWQYAFAEVVSDKGWIGTRLKRERMERQASADDEVEYIKI